MFKNTFTIISNLNSGDAFDDLAEMNLDESDQPSTMVFWRLVFAKTNVTTNEFI